MRNLLVGALLTCAAGAVRLNSFRPRRDTSAPAWVFPNITISAAVVVVVTRKAQHGGCTRATCGGPGSVWKERSFILVRLTRRDFF